MLGSLPDVQFVDTDVNMILDEMIESFEEAYYQQTGIQKRLYPGDPIRIFIYTQALRELQLRESLNYAAKQNLLAYAEGEYLDHFAARYGIERSEGSNAVLTVLFTLSTAVPTLIPLGTRLVVDGIYFETVDDVFVESGQTSGEAVVMSQAPGQEGNAIQEGTEMTIVDPLPFVISAVSAESAVGGADRETDEELRERIYSTPESLSVAGPEDAYKSMIRNYSNAVLDVAVRQSSPGTVEVTVLLDEGAQPNEAFLSELEAYLSDGKRRPLTDYIIVKAPDEVKYDLDVTYYLLREQSGAAQELTEAINAAVQEFVAWQKGKIGRDVNPSELTFKMRQAGAKRVAIRSPEFSSVDFGKVAMAGNVNVVFGGFENE